MIYFIQAGDGPVKIGYAGTRKQVRKRLHALQIGSHERLRLLGVVPGDVEAEGALHRHFAACRIRGEWFQPDPEIVRIADQPTCVDWRVDYQLALERWANAGLLVEGQLTGGGASYIMELERVCEVRGGLPILAFLEWVESNGGFGDDLPVAA